MALSTPGEISAPRTLGGVQAASPGPVSPPKRGPYAASWRPREELPKWPLLPPDRLPQTRASCSERERTGRDRQMWLQQSPGSRGQPSGGHRCPGDSLAWELEMALWAAAQCHQEMSAPRALKPYLGRPGRAAGLSCALQVPRVSGWQCCGGRADPCDDSSLGQSAIRTPGGAHTFIHQTPPPAPESMAKTAHLVLP